MVPLSGDFMESNWKLLHVGIPVRDLDKSMKDYQTLGTASFQPEFVIDSSKFAEYLVYGKTPDPVVRTRVAMGRVGPLRLNCCSPFKGKRSTRSSWRRRVKASDILPTRLMTWRKKRPRWLRKDSRLSSVSYGPVKPVAVRFISTPGVNSATLLSN